VSIAGSLRNTSVDPPNQAFGCPTKVNVLAYY
jgi:hypothetical protein